MINVIPGLTGNLDFVIPGLTGNLDLRHSRLDRESFYYLCSTMRKIVLSLSFMLFAVLTALAQSGAASFGGRVVDENGPIEGVTVVAIHQGTNAQYSTTTDAGGWWQLPDVLTGGPYTLRIHYFGYNPLTVRGLYTYAGQNIVVDADLEAGTSYAYADEAATSLRLGPELGGGTVPVSPLGYDLVSQRIFTPVAFDVRQEASLYGMAQQWTVPTGASRFHGSAYGFASVTPGSTSSVTPGSTGSLSGLGGLNLATPLGNQDYQLFAGAQYDRYGLSAAGRFDARLGAANRLDVSGGRFADAAGSQAWAGGDWFTSLGDGKQSNRAQALWTSAPTQRQLLVEDDFTMAMGRQRLLAGVQFAHQNFLAADSTANRFDFYVQDAVRFGQRITLLGGVRFTFPFAFSPRLSLYYDILGNGKLVMRVGTAVYGRHGEGTVWKNLAAFDVALPLQTKLTIEGIYGQAWRKAFYISSHNVMDSHYALTARLERPFSDRLWALASYTRCDGSMTDRVMAGFSYKALYFSRFATTLSALYDGGNFIDDLSPASLSWEHTLEARLSQDFCFQAAGREHTLQLTAYVRTAFTSNTQFLFGLRYFL